MASSSGSAFPEILYTRTPPLPWRSCIHGHHHYHGILSGGGPSNIYACRDGFLTFIPVSSELTPQDAIIRVRFNSTDNSYRLQITEANPPVYVQLALLSQGGLLCTPGVPGTPMRFSLRSSKDENLPQQMSHVLHEVVDTA
ncbi:hypothetical protein KP509_04G044600 [Ceratopteris richardii]|uniref:Uncharacterized protein n=1 Tax=Ceratopteris richardii TaxID=49495 RepID=A0A8T2UYT4_CERRI|nr:hypothetical protein KP509_04G044600 [Ceratopteris richardii]